MTGATPSPVRAVALQRSQTPKGLEGVQSRQDRRSTANELQRSQTPKGLEGWPRAIGSAHDRCFNEAKPRRVWKGVAAVAAGGQRRRFNEAKPRRVWKERTASRTLDASRHASTKPNPEGFGREQLLDGDDLAIASFNEAKPRRVWKAVVLRTRSHQIDIASTKPNPEGFGRGRGRRVRFLPEKTMGLRAVGKIHPKDLTDCDR